MNGLGSDEIEERAKRCFSCGGDIFNDIYSCKDGYHSYDETVGSLIESDANQLKKLNISREDIVVSIKRVVQLTFESEGINIDFENKNEEQIISLKEYLITFDGTDILKEEMKKYSKPQQLIVRRKEQKGYQYSLFYNPSLKDSEMNTRWNCEYEITNCLTGLRFVIAGNDLVGVIQFIEKYGYFEGKKGENKYRVEPSFVLAILFGIITHQTIGIYSEYIDIKTKSLNQIINTLKSRHELTNDEIEIEWINKQIQKTKMLLSQWQSDSTHCLNQLISNLNYIS